MKTIEERRKYDRERMAKWLSINPEKRERNRLKNIEWRKNHPKKYLACAARYRKNNKKKIKSYRLSVAYGISIEEYQKMHDQQKGLCAICKLPETAKHNHTKKVQQLAVDHCHKTGKVRGLLCQDCNRGIGKFFDDISRLQSAINYLTIHSS